MLTAFKRISVLLILLTVCSCWPNREANNYYIIHLSAGSSSRTDFLQLFDIQDDERGWFFKNGLQNKIDIYSFPAGKIASSIYLSRHKFSAAEIQSATWINKDTILVLFKNIPVLYYFNFYGTLFDKMNLPGKVLPSLPITTNAPVAYKGRLYVSLIPGFRHFEGQENFVADELIIDYRFKRFEIKKFTHLSDSSIAGIRHRLATRTLAHDKLYYLWGGCNEVLVFSISDNSTETIRLPVF